MLNLIVQAHILNPITMYVGSKVGSLKPWERKMFKSTRHVITKHFRKRLLSTSYGTIQQNLYF